jgi:hypothetical protein
MAETKKAAGFDSLIMLKKGVMTFLMVAVPSGITAVISWLQTGEVALASPWFVAVFVPVLTMALNWFKHKDDGKK